MVILGEKETWGSAYNCMVQPDFLERLEKINYADITQAIKHSL